MSNDWLRYGAHLTSALRGVLREVHAVRAVQDTPLPYCVYRRVGIEPYRESLDKDSGADPLEVSFEVHIYTAEYVEGIGLIERAIEALKGIDNLVVDLVDSSEGVAEDGLQFVQSITINVR